MAGRVLRLFMGFGVSSLSLFRLAEWFGLFRFSVDAVTLVQPLAEIDQPAALAAEGPPWRVLSPGKADFAGGASGLRLTLLHL